MDEFAGPLPTMVTGDLLGLPRADAHRIGAWSNAMSAMLHRELGRERFDGPGRFLVRHVRDDFATGDARFERWRSATLRCVSMPTASYGARPCCRGRRRCYPTRSDNRASQGRESSIALHPPGRCRLPASSAR